MGLVFRRQARPPPKGWAPACPNVLSIPHTYAHTFRQRTTNFGVTAYMCEGARFFGGQPCHCMAYCTHASRGLSAKAKFLFITSNHFRISDDHRRSLTLRDDITRDREALSDLSQLRQFLASNLSVSVAAANER